MAASIEPNVTSGSAGEQVRVTGEGWLAGEIVQVYLNGEWSESVPADGGGRLDRYVKIPSGIANGSYLFSGVGANSGRQASSSAFTVS